MGARVAPVNAPTAASAWKFARDAQKKSIAVAALTQTKPKRPTMKRPARAVAKGSRISRRFSGGYVYFLELERSWWFCLGLSLGAYLISITLCALLAASATLQNTQEDLKAVHGFAVASWELCLRFAAAHVITLGTGPVVPLDSWGYLLAWLQMVLGTMRNLFVFAMVLAKFQAPQSDRVWSDGGVIRPRDGVPHLLFRAGNLRCHTLYSPSIRLTLLRRHVTKEGESFFRRYELEVDQPATLSGVLTVAHAITADSPLAPLLESGLLQKAMDVDDGDGESSAALAEGSSSCRGPKCERLSIHAVIQAFDNVYGGDLSATTTYTNGSIRFDAGFEDMLRTVNGKQTIDWDHFNTTLPSEQIEARR